MTEPIVENPIDVKKWNRAKWEGVAFAVDLEYQLAPSMSIIFGNGTAGKEIFANWQKVVGEEDIFEELRVAIVEGDIPGQDPGYSVQVGGNPDGLIRLAKSQGIDLVPEEIVVVSRVYRVNPAPDSPYLGMFKEAYRQMGKYILAPSSHIRGKVRPHPELGILKKEIHFRHVDEIEDNDLDSMVLRVPDSGHH